MSRSLFACLPGLLFVVTAACSEPASDAPAEPAGAATGPAPSLAPAPAATPAPKLDAPLEVGSQEAKDDMYCSGLLIAANSTDPEALSPSEMGREMKAQLRGGALFEAAAAKLVAEGAALYEQTADVSDAWLAVAQKDLDQAKPRISLDDCAARAEALPKPATP